MATKQRGRPRSFDREAALEQATLAFWEHGYETTSVADLTKLMGIGAPSLYAAFGDKKALFAEVMRHYAQTYAAFSARALDEEPTAREGLARMLRETAVEFTAEGHPHGCLTISAGINCTTPEVVEALRAQRGRNIRSFESRIAADQAAGHLPADADPAALARFAGAVLQGMSQQARDGATREELEALVDVAMAAWPR